MSKRNWGICLVGLAVLFILSGYLYTPYPPDRIEVAARLQPPSKKHLLGTDHLGRDLLSRILVGGRASLFIGSLAVVAGAFLGLSLGLVAGFWGGLGDELAMRLGDGLQSLPSILLALLLAAVWQPGPQVVLWAVALGNIPVFLRLTRVQVLRIKTLPFVEASRACGVSDGRLIFRHILPNIRDALVVQFSMSLAGAILAEASLSYLGVGIQPPFPSWGRMLREAQSFVSPAPWLVIVPGSAIALLVIGFNFLGDAWIERR